MTRVPVAVVAGLLLTAASPVFAALDTDASAVVVGVVVILTAPDFVAELLAVEVGLVVIAASTDLTTEAAADVLGDDVGSVPAAVFVADAAAALARLAETVALAGFVASLVAATVGELLTPVVVAVCVVPPVVTTVSVGRFATVPFDGVMNVNAPSGNVPEMLEVNTSSMRTVPRAATSVASVPPERVKFTFVFTSAVLNVLVA